MAELKHLLKKTFLPIYTQTRTWVRNRNIPGGIQYPGFKYYPRHADFKDPPYEPTKLFLVKRIKPVWGTNPKERRALQLLNLDGHFKQQGHIAIVKNIAENNELLWRIKHMITISPITCDQVIPENVGLGQTHLHDNGRLVVTPLLKVPDERALTTQKFIKDPKRISRELLGKYLRDRWDNPWQGTMND